MLLPTGLYAGPPFGWAGAFCFPSSVFSSFCHPELVEGFVGLGIWYAMPGILYSFKRLFYLFAWSKGSKTERWGSGTLVLPTLVFHILFSWQKSMQKLKTKRCFCARAFKLARRLVCLSFFILLFFLLFVILSLSKDLFAWSFPSCYGGVPKGRGGQFLYTNSLNLYGRLVHHYGRVLQAYGWLLHDYGRVLHASGWLLHLYGRTPHHYGWLSHGYGWFLHA